ncbi:hypothetical protein H2204_012793 [Knufia peltigerae]|uniref:FAD-binding domain-containing protein n=1 Tax=Knufia peltigerae TaxID=1002370 RepID=A0AA38XRS4_9EURO|nr:hypothetical protein H2204_012793 [Knufia peltigerae]
MGCTKFKVIIAGGGIAGLSLANMLQKTGIDFVVLEAYPELAPQVGASIGLLPHGLRILDQLGLYKPIRKLVAPLDHFHFRNLRGEIVAEHEGVADSFMARHGYGMLFLDRQAVLKVLFENIQDKSKLLTGKCVVNIKLEDDGVTVTTKDGSVYNGDICIGADGIHSNVRSEMWRNADALCPGYIPDTEPTCINPGSLHSVFREHSSYLILGGLHRTYWFYFFNIGKTVYSPNIPRYTKEDEAKIIQDRLDDAILPNLKFRDIYKNKVSSTLTALPEYAFQKWHFGRIMTIGDASHKMEPISGHGGNAAIETAATLTNALVKALAEVKGPQRSMSAARICKVFQNVQETRMKRVQKLITDSHNHQRFEALEGQMEKILALNLLPLSDTDDVLMNASKNIPQGQRLQMLENPFRARLIPFHDDLACTPQKRGWKGWAWALFFLSLSVVGYCGMHILPTLYSGVQEKMVDILTSSTFYQGTRLRTRYTGYPAVDETLTMLTVFFMPGVAGWDSAHQTLQVYFLFSLFPLITVWTVESCRKRNFLSLISFTSLWSIYQLYGIAVVAPIFYIMYLTVSNPESYWWPLSRPVPEKYVKTLLPAVVLGYLIPTILMFWPHSNDDQIRQGFIAFWQPSPVYVNILLWLLATSYNTTMSTQQDHSNVVVAAAEPPDMAHLKRLYAFSFGVSIVTHFGVLLKVMFSADPHLQLSKIFLLPPLDQRSLSVVESLHITWLVDFWVWTMATMAWCCLSVWDLKRVGLAVVSVRKAAAAVALGTVLVGPGAVISACWYWRETQMAKTTIIQKASTAA